MNQLIENSAVNSYFNEIMKPIQMGGGNLPKIDTCSLREYLQTSNELVKNVNMKSTQSGISMNTLQSQQSSANMLTIIQEEDNSVSYRTYGSRTVQNTGDQQS